MYVKYVLLYNTRVYTILLDDLPILEDDTSRLDTSDEIMLCPYIKMTSVSGEPISRLYKLHRLSLNLG